MAVKIRLAQRGKKKTRTYRVVVADARSPRDGKYIEDLGFYNPHDKEHSNTSNNLYSFHIFYPFPPISFNGIDIK